MKSFISSERSVSLGSLSPVLHCIPNLYETKLLFGNKQMGMSFSFEDLKNEPCVKSGVGFCIAISAHDGTTLYVTSTVTDILGYPKDMLTGQCILNFLYPHDRIAFAGQLTQGLNAHFVEKGPIVNQGSTFFCRMRQYQSLKFGYGVSDKRTKYKPFQIAFHIKNVEEKSCVEEDSKNVFFVATAIPIVSAYKFPEEIPVTNSFSTRHTSSCHFSHVDSSSVAFLGYLPQDMIGYSIFDFYHMDDMLRLKDIYELVIKEQGLSFRSKPYRFRVFNGFYITIETEWSCFINPWSSRVEFVLGQHHVLKGPADPDIFKQSNQEDVNVSDEMLKQSHRIQEEITSLLSQPIKKHSREGTRRHVSRWQCNMPSSLSSLLEETKLFKMDETQGIQEGRSCSDQGSVVMGEISPHQELNDSDPASETPPSFQEMRYQENIERFFASQPKTYSSDGSAESKSDRQTATMSIDEGKNSKFSSSSDDKDQIYLQSSNSTTGYESRLQASSSSSSERKISSVTTGDSGNSSLAAENGIQQKNNNNLVSDSSNGRCDPNSNQPCLTLTEEMLSQHNRLTHKILKQRKGKVKSSLPKKDGHCLKRSFSPCFLDMNLGPHKHNRPNKAHQNVTTATTPTQTDYLDKYGCLQSSTVPVAAFSLNPPFSIGGFSVMPQPHSSMTTSPITTVKDSSTNSTFGPALYSVQIPNFAMPTYSYLPNNNTNNNNNGNGAPNPVFMPVMYVGAMPVYPSISAMTPQSGTLWQYGPVPAGCQTTTTTTTTTTAAAAKSVMTTIYNNQSLDNNTLTQMHKIDGTNNMPTYLIEKRLDESTVPTISAKHFSKSSVPNSHNSQHEQQQLIDIAPNTALVNNDSASGQDVADEVMVKLSEIVQDKKNIKIPPSDIFINTQMFQEKFKQNEVKESIDKKSSEKSERYADKDSQEDTTSLSFTSSLLKSEDLTCHSSSSKAEDSEFEKKEEIENTRPVRLNPPWMDGVDMTQDVVFHYQLKTRDVTEVLKKDLASMQAMEQPELVIKQLAVLHSELDESGNSRNIKLKNNNSGECDSHILVLGFATLEEDLEELQVDSKRLPPPSSSAYESGLS